MNDLELFGNAMELVTGMVEIRKGYNSIRDIANNETYSEEERKEAKSLTEGGIYKYMGRLNQANGKR